MERFYTYDDILKGVHKREQVSHVLAAASGRTGVGSVGVQAKLAPGSPRILNQGAPMPFRVGAWRS
jgi:hypothetical protein